LLAHLDEIGLPHAVPLRDLIARYGIVKSPHYAWDVLRYEAVRPFVDGQVGPFEHNAFGPPFAPDLLPPTRFSTFVAPSSDARANHAHALARIEARYGAGASRASSNTLGHEWVLGTACIRLTTWPADLERFPMSNPAHERHPEMRAFSHLTIETGHVVALSPAEEDALRARVAFGPLPRGARAIIAPLDHEVVRGTTRCVPEGIACAIPEVGMSAAGDAVVGIDGQRAFVVAREDVRGLELIRAMPARGPGRSTLELIFEDRWSTRRERRRRTLFEGAAPHDLDALTAQVEAALGIAAEARDALDD
jgi:hypothetical protein